VATRRRMRRDEGQALPLLAGVLALVGTLLIGLVALGNLVGERSRAQTAADAAALAGAAKGRDAAEVMARENEGELRSYASKGTQVEVVVRVGEAEATARAERSW
jgi:outer membrane lipoprotein SlyB